MERITRLRVAILVVAFGLLIGFFALRLYDIQMIQTGGDSEATLVRNIAEKHIEIDNAVLITCLQIAVGHGELIKVTQHGQIQFLSSHFCTPKISAHSACSIYDYRSNIR